ncbi:cysteine hydrolase family protein [Paenibacillus sp. J22TS3]|uniref:cysteine hydrolase family protein n=1 Tax=Paenibacillus sp. J22TS3 TaxID=2807192 RepID=UPI001B12655B|nr:cysteine hydrolase [Paenibacillus sp. J22TS3]GIP22697.1 hypothetical isochorismatase hydrolase [Paenibacillus sp. J22TS3]
MSKYTTPNLEKAAVITIDTQNDFTLPGAAAEIAGTYEVLPNMARILETCRLRNMPVVHVIRIYQPDGSNADLCRRELLQNGSQIVHPGTFGAQLVDVISPNPNVQLNYAALLDGQIQPVGPQEWVMYKPRWGAFYQTGLEQFARELGVDTLIFIGCNFPNCPRTSIYEASERDFKVILIDDAMSGVYEKGLQELANIGVHAYKTEQFLSKFEALNKVL